MHFISTLPLLDPFTEKGRERSWPPHPLSILQHSPWRLYLSTPHCEVVIPCRSALRNKRKYHSPLPFPTSAPHPWQTRSPAVPWHPSISPWGAWPVPAFHSSIRLWVSAGCSHPSGCCRSNLFLTRTEGPSQPAAGVCLCAHHWIYWSATQAARPSAQDLHPDRHLTQLPFRLSLMAPSGPREPGSRLVCSNLVLLTARAGLSNLGFSGVTNLSWIGTVTVGVTDLL